MTDATGALPGGEMMITVGLYCEIEDTDKFSEPFFFTSLVIAEGRLSLKRGSRQKHFC